METIRCYKCQEVWDFEPPMGRGDECPKCRVSCRVCLNCRFYDRNSYRECRENQAEWVQDKAQANFCGYFSPNAKAAGPSEADSAKSKLDAFFGGGGQKPKTPAAGSMADQLEQFLKNKK